MLIFVFTMRYAAIALIAAMGAIAA